jgi:hypothetical protein
MTSEDAMKLVKQAMELSKETVEKKNASDAETKLAGVLADTAFTLMQAVEFIQVLQLENEEGRRLLNLAKVVMEAMDSANPTQALLNAAQMMAGEQMTVDGQACCDCDTCSKGCGCGEDTEDTDDGRSDKCTDGCNCDDSSECASCPTPPKNLMN